MALRVLVLSADVGEGHLAMARAVAAELANERPGFEVAQRDGLGALGWLQALLIRDGYRLQLRWLPWLYGFLYGLFRRFAPARALARAGFVLQGSRRLARLVGEHRPDVVVSTHPALNVVLGYLRLRGRLGVPVYTAIIDHGDIMFWAHPGIDLHLVMHEESVGPVERLAGPGSARRVRPLVAPEFFEPLSREDARRAFRLPQNSPVIVVSGGGWGVGDLEGAARAALRMRDATVVCLTGRSQAVKDTIASAFVDEPRVLVPGFTDRMSTLLTAADALVLSSGGMTCLEALVRGCPIVVYSAPPGHARANAEALASLGLARVVDTAEDVAAALEGVLAAWEGQGPTLPPAPGAASVIEEASRRHGRGEGHRARGGGLWRRTYAGRENGRGVIVGRQVRRPRGRRPGRTLGRERPELDRERVPRV